MTSNELPVAPAIEAAESRQLELFVESPAESSQGTRGLSREVARACLPPGWWRHVAELYDGYYYRDLVVVRACHEHDGALIVDADLPGAGDSLESVLQHMRGAAARTCGCCAAPGHAYRVSLDGPTRIVCDACRERLRSGESVLAIADDHFALDGTHRNHVTERDSRRNITAQSTRAGSRVCCTLPADELRQVIAEIRTSMLGEIVGQDQAVRRIAILAGLHVGGGLSRGGRALILGPSGVGKTSLMRSMKTGLEPWAGDVPWVACDAIEISSPGWSGAPAIGDLIERAIDTVSQKNLRKAVIVIDEIHHIGVTPNGDLSGNMRAKKEEVIASLLALTSGGVLTFASGRTWSAQDALVITMGAFTNLLPLQSGSSQRSQSTFTIDQIVEAGLPLELATRVAQDIIVLTRLSEPALVELLKRWPSLLSLRDLCVRLGYAVHITEEAIARAARVVTLGHDGSTPRTAGGWLVSALRQGLMTALDDPGAREIVVAPDTLEIPSTATRPKPPKDPPSNPGDWDATLILSPRR